MNFKEHELSLMLFHRLQHHFPEIELAGVTESIESADQIWVKIVMPSDEDREIALRELAAEMATDILMDYGYHITILSSPNVAGNLAQA